MMSVEVSTFEQWKDAARYLVQNKIYPQEVQWNTPQQQSLFTKSLSIKDCMKNKKPMQVPKDYMQLAASVCWHRDNKKWHILYQVLWRIIHGEKNLMKRITDNDIFALNVMKKQINRDAHKMKAFVRFRKVVGEDNAYVAWYEPSHLVLQPSASFFVRRFKTMRWSILTPDCSAHWNGRKLQFTKGLSRDHAPKKDEMEELWKIFYQHIFNPARIKTKMMKSEMPVKYWHTMPETALIPKMLSDADQRVKEMMKLMHKDKQKK